MIIPAVMFLEMTLDTMEALVLDETVLVKELQEFRALGNRVDVLEKLLPDCTELERGYILGLQTCRTLLATMPVAIQAGVTL